MKYRVKLFYFLFPLLYIALSCTEYGLNPVSETQSYQETGSIHGRICAPEKNAWLPDVHVYVNLVDKNEIVYDIRETWTDIDGYFLLEDIPARRGVTVYAQKGSFTTTFTVDVNAGMVNEIPEPECIDPKSIDMAVVTGAFDDVEEILNDMGFTIYDVVDGLNATTVNEFFKNKDLIFAYDIIFINCGFNENEVLYDEMSIRNITEYLMAGGSLYISDWAYDLIEKVFPEYITFLGDDSVVNDAQHGVAGEVEGYIPDQKLANFIGTNKVLINYDLPLWALIHYADPSVTIHVTGDVQYQIGQDIYSLGGAPLLVSFIPEGSDGKVVFTTFHEQANLTEDMKIILEYMLFEL